MSLPCLYWKEKRRSWVAPIIFLLRCVLDEVRMYFGQNPQDFDEWHLRLGPARACRARGKTQKFPIIFYCGSPHTPRREAEHLKGRKFLVLLPPLHSSKKAYKCILAFSPVLRPPFLRRLWRPEAYTMRFALRRNQILLCLPRPPCARTNPRRFWGTL